MEPLPGPARHHPGVRLVFAWSPLLPTIGLGSLFALTDQPWYPVYLQAPRVWGLSVMDDQRLGGIIMWLGGGMMYVTAAAVLFFVLLAVEEHTALTAPDPGAGDAVVGGAEPR